MPGMSAEAFQEELFSYGEKSLVPSGARPELGSKAVEQCALWDSEMAEAGGYNDDRARIEAEKLIEQDMDKNPRLSYGDAIRARGFDRLFPEFNEERSKNVCARPTTRPGRVGRQLNPPTHYYMDDESIRALPTEDQVLRVQEMTDGLIRDLYESESTGDPNEDALLTARQRAAEEKRKRLRELKQATRQ